jgi:type VI secretion system VasD/TssJ family lipoprotein
MKRFVLFTAAIAFASALAACGSAPQVQAPALPQVQAPASPPDFRKAAIELSLKADVNLNLYQAVPHTLVVCIYELRDPNAFNQLIDEQDGVMKLLECGRFDRSVTYAKKLVLQPGEKVRKVLDQAEGAKYLGLVAGYFASSEERPYRLYRIPKAEGDTPTPMKVDLYLGSQTILDARAK